MQKMDKLDQMRRALAKAMEARGAKAKPLSRLAGLGETAVRDILDREIDPKIGTLYKLAAALDMSLDSILRDPVRIVGSVSASGFIEIDPKERENLMDRSQSATGNLIGFAVDGCAMLPKYEPGDVVAISAKLDRRPEELIGRYCVIFLKSGETYLRRLEFGSKPNLFNLAALNAGEIRDVEIEAIGPVEYVIAAEADQAALPPKV